MDRRPPRPVVPRTPAPLIVGLAAAGLMGCAVAGGLIALKIYDHLTGGTP